MKITNVTVKLLKGDYRVRAFAAFTIDDEFVVLRLLTEIKDYL